MQIDKQKLIDLIRDSAKKVLSELPDDQRVDFTESSDLFGGNSPFDSLMLVNFVVELEQALEANFNLSIALADERAMEQPENPFVNVKSLVSYLELLISEK